MPYINLQPVGQYTYDPATQTYTAQPNTYLAGVEPVISNYYAAILAQEQGDVNKAIRRLEEDYSRGMRIPTEDYERKIRQSQEDYSRGMTTSREAYQASLAEQQATNLQEQRGLTGNLLQRGVSQGGLAGQLGGELKTRQDLRREAIDRALRKSEEELSLNKTRTAEELGVGKTRAQEEASLNKLRGAEDVALGFSKFKLEKGQEQREKGLSLAEQAYNREFGRQSTEKGFEFSQQSLDLARKTAGV